MDASLYDDFGNYIGPELDASDGDDRASDEDVRHAIERTREHQLTLISHRFRARIIALTNVFLKLF